MVDGILGRLRDELGEETQTLATGGLAGAIVPYCQTIDEVDDLLTLDGPEADLGAQPRLDSERCAPCAIPGPSAD